jgi:hypothetical protein
MPKKRGPKHQLPQEPGAVQRIGVRVPIAWARALRRKAGGSRKLAGYLRPIVDGAIQQRDLPDAVDLPDSDTHVDIDVLTVRLVTAKWVDLVDLAGGERLVAGRLRALIWREVQHDETQSPVPLGATD